VRAANGPKDRLRYQAGHELNDVARADRDAWLAQLFGG